MHKLTGLFLALILLLACTGCGNSKEIAALQERISALESQLEQSETQRIGDAYDFQRQIEALSSDAKPISPPAGQSEDFSAALRNGEIHSVMVIGDSISDGNGDYGFYFDQQVRADAGYRLVCTDENGDAYYEAPPDAQGGVKYFRNYLLENTSVTEFYNNAISGKSAKWYNAHKETLFDGGKTHYDAIFVMLGTNDRWHCLNQEEFYTEYSQLLSYLKGQCDYLTVFVPVPTFDDITESPNMSTRQIADTVLQVCGNNNYKCYNLYTGLMAYARSEGRSLDEYYIGGTHPNSTGYLALWRLIAEDLGLSLDITQTYDRSSVLPAVVIIGENRPEITERSNLTDTYQGIDLFPEGISIYVSRDAFISDIEGGGTVVTMRYYYNAGYQIFRPFDSDSRFIRYAGTDGVLGPWSTIDSH